MLQEKSRVDASKDGPITGKFLVGTVPCWIRFKFDNDYSWLREKVISYKVTVTPPSLDTLYAGRRRRAKACLKAVGDDLTSADKRRRAANDQLTLLETELEELKLEMAGADKRHKLGHEASRTMYAVWPMAEVPPRGLSPGTLPGAAPVPPGMVRDNEDVVPSRCRVPPS